MAEFLTMEEAEDKLRTHNINTIGNPLSVVFLFKSNNYETHFSTENI